MFRKLYRTLPNRLRTNGPSFFFGLLVAALAGNRNPWLVWPGTLGLFICAVLWLWESRKRRRYAATQNEFFRRLRGADPEAEIFRKRCGRDVSVVGKVVEVWHHQSLESMQPLEDVGLDPSIVNFLRPVQADFRDVVRACGGLGKYPPPNKHKYGIKKLPLLVVDDEDFTVEFSRTDFNTWQSVQDKTLNDSNLRWQWSHLDPTLNRLPQSMSLQYIVRFIDTGELLTMWRKRGLKGQEGKWSFSGEEQLDERDFASTTVPVAEFFFRRCFIEEVFGRRVEDEARINQIWDEHCAKLVYSHRIWSFFMEENTGIFQTFGVYNLHGAPAQLREIHERALSAGWGARDDEGPWYTVTWSGAEKLLTDGHCEANRLHGTPEPAVIKAETDLHTTSRYRLWRLYVAMHRKPETLITLDL